MTTTSIGQRTLILVKPDGYARGLTGEILRRIESKGYTIAALQVLVPDWNVLAQHYAEHQERPFFDGLIQFMSSGRVVAAVIEGEDVVKGIRTMMGATNPSTAAPGTIRGDFGRAWEDGVIRNIIHGSDSPGSAEREIDIWFPELGHSTPEIAAE